ncbi:isochorismatase family protein [Pusillimonas noertemannii]|uniref:isochorismatase family protein n=1 Tax=Pusillimonas noertemannii TaxID=305977 RepID=UPI000318FD38|nr:cysteine hydrolase [Pusillimonas noertemannii]
MHPYTIPESVKERVLRRKGRLICLDTIDPAKTALVVIDMQNHFVAEGFPSEAPPARGIVDNINRMSSALREVGGTVVWIQTTATDALNRWANHHRHGLRPEVRDRRLASLAEDAPGFQLYPALQAQPNDLYIRKIMFSAMLPVSSNLHETLRGRDIDTVLIAGTTTNVCCDSTARDAMMLDYRVALLSDATATRHDEEHAATLNNFQLFFGDVMTIDEAIERLGRE